MTRSLTDFGLDDFLRDQCDATKAKYAAELEHANGEWQKPIDLWYAETLVDYFGLLERNVETLYDESGKHVRGSRITFRKAAKCSTDLSESTPRQTEEAVYS